MTKDYFQDIIPPSSGDRPKRPTPVRKTTKAVSHQDPPHPSAAHHAPEPELEEMTYSREDVGLPDIPAPEAETQNIRGIRNINLPPRARPRIDSDFYSAEPPVRTSSGRLWLWLVALICVLFLVLLGFVALRSTVVTVVPRSHPIVFDQSSQFVAYPAETAATGTLPYTIQTTDMDDSDVVASSGGVTHVETKTSGSITVYNSYSASPVRLVANTRFESPSHLIYRAPNDIVIPGKQGSTPGSVSVTVAADQAGEQYNISSSTRLTLPGLASNAAMFSGVYANATNMAGGFVGDQAAIDPAVRSSTVAAIRARLQDKAQKAIIAAAGANSTVFTGLMQITYQDLPDTTESNGTGLHESIHVTAPVFPSDVFAQYVGSAVAADTESSSLRIEGGANYAAVATDVPPDMSGTAPIHFTLSGNATLIWNVDTVALSQALAGKDQTAFKTIVSNFPGVQEAHARIEPFWKSTFPSDPTKIKIAVTAPASAPGGAN